MSVKEEIKSQIIGVLQGADFPIETPGAFPEGADTTCKAGDVEMIAGEAGDIFI